ncbi:MAG: Rrf2 family transcriptional regulator [Promethearchaeota archaeon]|nr:MAG: Rrf2 family transcriptional regulator [Candidatus Lokiarchaeota archaeon]
MRVFSEKINYALSALFELANNFNQSHMQIKDISKAQNIPKSYLEKLLISLKRGNLVESVRGAQGGYKLKKPPNKIRIIDIIEVLESSITILDYSKNTEVLQAFWKNIEVKFKDLLNITLEDLVNEEVLLRKRLNYQI